MEWDGTEVWRHHEIACHHDFKRLPNGNTRPTGDTMGWLFRAYRYSIDYPGLAGRDLDPTRLADLNRLYGLA